VGSVVAVDLAASTLTFEVQRTGEEITLLVDENTRFRSRGGLVEGLEDLQAGQPLLVVYRQQPDGSYLALQVLAGRPARR
jgi:hypothetical protein